MLLNEITKGFNRTSMHSNRVTLFVKNKFFDLNIEMFYYITTLTFEVPPLLVFQLEVYYKADRLLTGLDGIQINISTYCRP